MNELSNQNLSPYRKLFKNTLIYGLATVLPRMISVILTPLYIDTLKEQKDYGDVSIIFSYMVFFNVLLSYGMETAFFRFYGKETNKENVVSTATITLFWSSISFLTIALLFKNSIAQWAGFPVDYITYTIWIVTLDALVIIPFSKLRAESKPIKYSIIKISNVLVNIVFSLFFLIYLPKLASQNPDGFFNTIYFENFQIGYIFISYLIASLFTFIVLLPNYFNINWKFDKALWKQMLRYGFPILIAGIAFAINEHFDKILLDWFHVSKDEIGAYSACYKIGVFMVLFRTAYTLGIEPFFFSHAGNENAQQTYATITKYFVIFGSLMSLIIIAFIDILKRPIVPKAAYWSAIDVVPLIVYANFFLGIYTNLSVWYKLIDKTMIGAYISIIGAMITLWLNYVLIGEYSYYGSAIATLAAYGSMMVISYYLGRKRYPIPYDFARIFSYLSASIVFSIVSFYVPYVREHFLIKMLLIFAFLYLIYHFEKPTLLRIIKRK